MPFATAEPTRAIWFVPSERFAENAWATLVCFFYALLLSYGIGLAIGVWMGIHRLSGAVGEPILISLYTLPKVTLYPVVLLIFGLSLSGRVTFGAMHGVLPVALLTMSAIRKNFITGKPQRTWPNGYRIEELGPPPLLDSLRVTRQS